MMIIIGFGTNMSKIELDKQFPAGHDLLLTMNQPIIIDMFVFSKTGFTSNSCLFCVL